MKSTRENLHMTEQPNASSFGTLLAVPKSSKQLAAEADRLQLLVRLSDAAARIREETELIQRTSFADPAGRLLRILGEAVEEQRLGSVSLERDQK